MACYQRKHPGNKFFTWISEGLIYWMLDVGHQEISKENSKRWLELRFRLQRLGARNLKL